MANKKQEPKSRKLKVETLETTEMGCPFCGQLTQLVVMKGYKGNCVLIQCINNKCQINPSTPMFDGKDAIKKCRKAWTTRALRLRRRKNAKK